MNTIRFTSKEAFIAALEGRRKFWRDFDARQTREHKAAERQWLTEARAKLRELAKADYATLKETCGNYMPLGRTPSCPALREPQIDRVLAAINHTQSTRFTVDGGSGAWREAHSLLTWDPDAPTSVC